jgi:uncharacterized protein YbbC (DUF1343 family)
MFPACARAAEVRINRDIVMAKSLFMGEVKFTMSFALRAFYLVIFSAVVLSCSSSARVRPEAEDTVTHNSEAGIADTLAAQTSPVVQTGLDRLIAENFSILKGKSVGLITNQTGRSSDKSGTPADHFGPHIFANTKVLKLVALYGPEHGIKGERQAGVSSDTLERFEGIPVYSLYGSTRKPSAKMLANVNALVFDIQDVGVRPYTFLSTMILAMEAAAESDIPFYVLDRPNPLSGNRIEGNVLDPSLKSFVGQVPVPYLHGMTLGELAQMAKGKGWFNAAGRLDLHVIKMIGWKRPMYWPQTGLPWTAPSPNVPHFENAVGLAMFGATGELGVLSVGVGTDVPFLRLGSNIVADSVLVRAGRMTIPFPVTYERYAATTSAGTKSYNGIYVQLPSVAGLASTLGNARSLYEPQFALLSALMREPAFAAALKQLPASTRAMYDKVTGVRGMLDSVVTDSNRSFMAHWDEEVARFRRERQPYLLY